MDDFQHLSQLQVFFIFASVCNCASKPIIPSLVSKQCDPGLPGLMIWVQQTVWNETSTSSTILMNFHRYDNYSCGWENVVIPTNAWVAIPTVLDQKKNAGI